MDSREKFSDKVSYYVKYRPSYPAAFIKYLMDELGLKGSITADIGAGTGILTKLLLDKAKKIVAVEPNENMRNASIKYCKGYDKFSAVNGSAENTLLDDNYVEYITVAQAFHWFDRENTKIEFQRILKPGGYNEFIDELKKLFKKYSKDGRILQPTNTHSYAGEI